MRIELQGLTLRFPGKPALFEGLDLVFESGTFVVVQGASGSGKSSLLRLLNRLGDPTQGRILIDGRSIRERDVTALRRELAYIHQTPTMVEGSVRDNFLLPFRFAAAGGKRPPDDQRMRETLDAHHLDKVSLSDSARTLSVGQQQRVALIRAMLTKPSWLLCDEPTSALDPSSRKVVESELEKANRKQRIGVVLVTHAGFDAQSVSPIRLTLTSEGLR